MFITVVTISGALVERLLINNSHGYSMVAWFIAAR